MGKSPKQTWLQEDPHSESILEPPTRASASGKTTVSRSSPMTKETGPLLVTLTLVERTLTTGWSTTLYRSSSASTRRTSLVTPVPCVVSALLVSVPSATSLPLPMHRLRLTLFTRVSTSTPQSPVLASKTCAPTCSVALLTQLRRCSRTPRSTRAQCTRLCSLVAPPVSPRCRS